MKTGTSVSHSCLTHTFDRGGGDVKFYHSPRKTGNETTSETFNLLTILLMSLGNECHIFCERDTFKNCISKDTEKILNFLLLFD